MKTGILRKPSNYLKNPLVTDTETPNPVSETHPGMVEPMEVLLRRMTEGRDVPTLTGKPLFGDQVLSRLQNMSKIDLAMFQKQVDAHVVTMQKKLMQAEHEQKISTQKELDTLRSRLAEFEKLSASSLTLSGEEEI